MNDAIELSLRKFVAPEFVFGSGARELTGQYCANLGIRKILLVTDRGVIEAGWTGDVIQSLKEEDLEFSVFSNLTPNPKAAEVMAGSEAYLAEQCDGIVAVGGGSPMDCAKGIGIVCSNGGSVLDYEGVDRVIYPLPPLICIPTTAGTAADVSQFAIITDSERRAKIAIVSKAIVPDVALIDPVCTTTMNLRLTSHTGMDAFCHATEAFVSNAYSPITECHALEAIGHIAGALPRLVTDLDDMQLRGKMTLGSLFAGLAFSNASLGAVHAMAHSLGGLLDLPHGMCNAILLEHVVAFNYRYSPERYGRVAQKMGIPVAGLNTEDAAKALVEGIAGLRRIAGVTERLSDLGMRKEYIPQLAVNALRDACLVTNPAMPRLEDVETIYEQAL
jgi:alcohol dehydrogenase class IV